MAHSTLKTDTVLTKEKLYLNVYMHCKHWISQTKDYLHGDVCYCGGGQVKVLLD